MAAALPQGRAMAALSPARSLVSTADAALYSSLRSVSEVSEGPSTSPLRQQSDQEEDSRATGFSCGASGASGASGGGGTCALAAASEEGGSSRGANEGGRSDAAEEGAQRQAPEPDTVAKADAMAKAALTPLSAAAVASATARLAAEQAKLACSVEASVDAGVALLLEQRLVSATVAQRCLEAENARLRRLVCGRWGAAAAAAKQLDELMADAGVADVSDTAAAGRRAAEAAAAAIAAVQCSAAASATVAASAAGGAAARGEGCAEGGMVAAAGQARKRAFSGSDSDAQHAASAAKEARACRG